MSVAAYRNYAGWSIFNDGRGSQCWVAIKHGVRIRCNSQENLITMIDLRENTARYVYLTAWT